MPYQAGYAVSDINSLKALTIANLIPGYARWVTSKNSWYGWDGASTATSNDDTVVAINEAPANGRFIKGAEVYLNVPQQFTKVQGVNIVALTDAAAIAVDGLLSNKFTVTLGGNRTLSNPTNLKDATYIFTIKQDATGSRTLAWGTNFKFPSGVIPVLSTFPNAVDELYCNSDGTVLRCVLNKDFK